LAGLWARILKGIRAEIIAYNFRAADNTRKW